MNNIPHGVCPDTEAWVPLPSGGVLAFEDAGSNANGTSYVRVLAANGQELGYWTSTEWAEIEDSENVMGAICGAMLGIEDSDSDDWYYQFGPNTTFPNGIEYEPHAALKVEDLQFGEALLDTLKSINPLPEKTKPEVEITLSIDGTWVVHIDSNTELEDAAGPLIRVYLNDESLYENPNYGEDSCE